MNYSNGRQSLISSTASSLTSLPLLLQVRYVPRLVIFSGTNAQHGLEVAGVSGRKLFKFSTDFRSKTRKGKEGKGGGALLITS